MQIGTWQVSPLTDEGQQRDHNEDAFWVPRPDWPRDQLTRLGALYLVADGMGGHAAGDVAAQIATRTIPQTYYADPDPNRRTALVRAIQAANAEILHQAQDDPRRTKMGATLVALVVQGDKLIIAHAGDSRAYLLRKGQLRRLTQDHTWVEERRQAQVLTDEEAAQHPMRNIVTRALGQKAELEPEIHTYRSAPGDALLLCSDGLSGPVGDERIRDILRRSSPPQAVQNLVDAANDAGGPDNITAVLVRRALDSATKHKSPLTALVLGAGGGILIGLLILLIVFSPWSKSSKNPISSAIIPTPTLTPAATTKPYPTFTPLPDFDASVGQDLNRLASQPITVTLPISSLQLTIPAQQMVVSLLTSEMVFSSGLSSLTINLAPEPFISPLLAPNPEPLTVTLAEVRLPLRAITTSLQLQPVGVMVAGSARACGDTTCIQASSGGEDQPTTYTLNLTLDHAGWLYVYALIDSGNLDPLALYYGDSKEKPLDGPPDKLVSTSGDASQAWFFVRTDEKNRVFWEKLNQQLDDFGNCYYALFRLSWSIDEGAFTPSSESYYFCCDSVKNCELRNLPQSSQSTHVPSIPISPSSP